MTRSNFEAASRRGADWILAQQDADGSFCAAADGVGGYYKVPYALASLGEIERARRLLDWVEAHHFTSDGDFRAPERKAREPFHGDWPVYANAWLVQGAQLAGRAEMAARGYDYIRRFQLPCGGYYALDRGQRYIEPVNTAWGGMAAIAVGAIDEARRAADLLARMVEEQPDPARFYYRMTAAGELVTGDAPCVDSRRTRQIYYHPGIALILLASFAASARSERHLAAARAIVAFSSRCAADVYRFPPSGKLGYGSALLWALTGDPTAQHAATAVAGYLTGTQQPDGRWILPDEEPYSSLAQRESHEVTLDVTAEFTIFLRGIAARLAD